MNWLKRLFGKKQELKEEQKRTSLNDNDLLSPANPLSPFWVNNDNNGSSSHSNYDSSSLDHNNNSSYDSGSSDSSSYDSGSSYDSSSSSSSGW